MAKRLLERFGSFTEVISAPPERLKEVKGIGDAAVIQLKLVRAAALRFMQGGIMRRPVLGSWNAVLDYCRAAMGFEASEQFRILFLDRKNCLIADEVQQRGTVDHTPVYVREVEAGTGAVGKRHRAGAQPSLRRSNTLAGRHRGDQADR